MNNSPCNPSSNLQNARFKARSNLVLPKSKTATMNKNNLCNAYKRCGKDASSLPPMKFVKTAKHVYLIDSNSPISAKEYGIIFGNSKLTDIKKIAVKLGFMVTKLNSKDELKGKIIEMLKKMGLNEPIQLPVTITKQISNNKPIGTPSNNNNNKPFGTPSNNNKNIFGTPSNNNKNKPFGTPSNNNNNKPFGTPSNNNNNKPFGTSSNNNKNIFGTSSNNNKNKPFGAKPSLFGGRQNANNKPSLFSGIKPRQNAIPGVNSSGRTQSFGNMKSNNGSGFTPGGKKPKVNASKLMQQISKEISNLKNKI